MEEKRSGTFILLIVGFFGSVFFAFSGYLVGGALGIGQEQGIGFGNGMIVVLSNPFAKYLTKYTPITVLLGFIVFETIYILYLFTRKKDEPVNAEEYKPDIIDLVDVDDVSVQKAVDPAEINDEELFGIVSDGVDSIAEEKKKGSSSNKTDFVSSSEKDDDSKKADADASSELDEKLSFGSEIMDEMLGERYTLDQMVAMINIKKYMKDVSADLLKRMFSPDMSPDEISSYISLFYE